MIRCVCGGCSAVVPASDDAAGTAVLCPQCGYLVQVPDPAEPAPAAAARGTAPPPKTATRTSIPRGKFVLGGLYGVFAVCLPVALTHSQDGSPLCLIMFGVNLLVGTAAGFLLLAGLHTPDYLVDWLEMPFTRLRALALLLPAAVLGFGVGIHIFSP